MNKKIIFIGSFAALLVFISGCGNNNKQVSTPTNNDLPAVENSAKETGKVIDLSNLNNQTVTTTPGDILYIKFTSDVSFKQHSISSPDAGAFVSLKDEEVKKQGNGYVNEWWFKVEKSGEFEIKFNYGSSGKKPEQIFSYNIVSI